MKHSYPKFIKSSVKSVYKIFSRKVLKKALHFAKAAGKRIYSMPEANGIIAQTIKSGKPCMIARFGSVENLILADSVLLELGLLTRYPHSHVNMLCNNAGFFPSDENSVKRFAALMKESAAQADLLGVWNEILEDYIIGTYSPNAEVVELAALEPYYHTAPWSAYLKGKKVLVIHPFAESIKLQYEGKRSLLFKNPEVLPTFELKTIKAVQTISGNKCAYKDWFEALDNMTQQALNTEFDVALIGAGAYGFPLAARIKAAGKQAIHLGGALQILFGIKGKRWEDIREVAQLFNEHWVRPLESEVPQNFTSVEKGCYW